MKLNLTDASWHHLSQDANQQKWGYTMNINSNDTLKQGRNVLLVDDEKMVLEVGKAILERLGHEVITAENGQDALDQFGHNKASIGCVVLDLTMPGMDGKTVFKQLRAQDPDLPIIIATGLSKGQVLEQFGEQPPTSIIQKPYHIADLSNKIESVFG